MAPPAADSYEVERSLDGNTWQILSDSLVGTTYEDLTVTASSQYYYRVRAESENGRSDWSTAISTTTPTSHEMWRLENFGSMENSGLGANAYVGIGGMSNLERFASNIATNSGQLYLNPDNGQSGMPWFEYDHASKRLEVHFMRRKATTMPGITYSVEFSDDLSNWETGGGEENVVSIDSVWERVTWVDSVTSDDQPKRFIRLELILD